MSGKKRFSKALFDQYDAVARLAGKKFLELDDTIDHIEDNPERYGADLIYWRGDVPFQLECEVKAVWAGGEFPYEDIQVLGRKTKYFEAGCNFFMLAADKKSWLFLRATDILSSPKEEVYNRFVARGEVFYKVPLALATFGQFEEEVNVTP